MNYSFKKKITHLCRNVWDCGSYVRIIDIYDIFELLKEKPHIFAEMFEIVALVGGWDYHKVKCRANRSLYMVVNKEWWVDVKIS